MSQCVESVNSEKGNRNKRRRQWIFVGILRGKFGLDFAQICPTNKRTKKALRPIIQDNLDIGTTIFSDGWRAYRKLPTIGYPHQWLDHSHKTSPYVHPTEVNHLTGEKDVHTNKIEGFWGCFKRWLPSSGPYNLEQYLTLYLWFQNLKMNQIDPFWALVELVKQNNSIDVMNEALDIIEECEGEEFDDAGETEVEGEDSEDSGSETSDSSSDHRDYPCPFCHVKFDEKEGIDHLKSCDEAH